MNILIIGAGAIGIALGTSFCSSGAATSFLASQQTKNAIDENGIKRTGLFGEISIPKGVVNTFSSYDTLPKRFFDFVLVCSKTMANIEISEKLSEYKDIFKDTGKIVIVQNGWGNDLPYLRFFPKNQVYCCRVITGFRRTAKNVSDITVHTAPLLFGSLYGYDSLPVKPLADALTKSNIPSEPTDEVGKALLAKLLYNTTLNPLGAVLGVNYGKLMDTPDSKAIMDDLIDETFAVLKAAQLETYWKSPEEYKKTFYSKLVPDTYNHRSSTLQDIEKKQKTEIDTLTGCILRLAEENNVSVPTHKMIYRLIKSLESQF